MFFIMIWLEFTLFHGYKSSIISQDCAAAYWKRSKWGMIGGRSLDSSFWVVWAYNRIERFFFGKNKKIGGAMREGRKM